MLANLSQTGIFGANPRCVLATWSTKDAADLPSLKLELSQARSFYRK